MTNKVLEDTPIPDGDKEVYDYIEDLLEIRSEQSEMTILINLLFAAGKRRQINPLMIFQAVFEVFGCEAVLMNDPTETKH